MVIVMSSLAYVTVDMPDRRLDVALPASVPLAELLPTLLRAGGTDLGARAAAHGGWCLRRVDGAPLAVAQTLDDQGVRDGDLLVLAGYDLDWPAPVVDDVAVAVSAQGSAERWSPAATRRTVAVAAGLLAVTAGAAIWRSGTEVDAVLSLAIAVVLLGAGFRAITADLAMLGLPYAAAGAAVLGRTGDRSLAAAGAAIGAYSLVALCSAGARRAAFSGGLAVAIGAVVAAAGWRLAGLTAAGATALGYAVLIGSIAPALAVRVGGLAAVERAGLSAGDRLGRAVTRTDEVHSGLLWTVPLVAAGGAAAMASTGRWPAWVLLAVVGLTLALRARLHQRAGHRVALLIAAAISVVPALAAVATYRFGAPVLLVASVVVVLVGAARTSPYLARLAEGGEIVAMAAVLPAICLNIGLFGQI
jgi:type VII secretion integral membrane protein EccD